MRNDISTMKSKFHHREMDQASKRNDGAGGERDAPPKPPGSLQSAGQHWLPRATVTTAEIWVLPADHACGHAASRVLGSAHRVAPQGPPTSSQQLTSPSSRAASMRPEAHRNLVSLKPQPAGSVTGHLVTVYLCPPTSLFPAGRGAELRRLGSGETQGRDGPVPGTSMEN